MRYGVGCERWSVAGMRRKGVVESRKLFCVSPFFTTFLPEF